MDFIAIGFRDRDFGGQNGSEEKGKEKECRPLHPRRTGRKQKIGLPLSKDIVQKFGDTPDGVAAIRHSSARNLRFPTGPN
jgi:hypothetical protein